MNEIKIKCRSADILELEKIESIQGTLKKITKAKNQKLKNSLLINGFIDPIRIWKVDEKFYSLDGVHRRNALLELKKDGVLMPEKFPIVYCFPKNKKEAKTWVLAMSSEYAKINEEGLKIFLDEAEIEVDEVEMYLDFSEVDINKLRDEPIEDEPPPLPKIAKSKLGDLYELGKHRILCGDSTDIGQVERLMGTVKADMVLTDPPYGINVIKSSLGKIGDDKSFGTSDNKGRGKIVKANIYKKIIGDNTIKTALKCYEISKKYSNKIILWGGNHYAHELPSSSCWIVWDKETSGKFGDGEIAWTNINRSILICRHKWSGMVKASEHGQKRIHPTQKPIYLSIWCFSKLGKNDKIIVDFFLGSGSTLIACEQTKRICYGVELEPFYIDVIIQRWVNFTGIERIKKNGKEIIWQKNV